MAKLASPLGLNQDVPFGNGGVPLAAVAAGTGAEVVIYTAVFPCTVDAVTLVFASTLTGQATNFTTLTVNHYAGGSKQGANYGTKAFSSGAVVATAFEAFALTVPVNAALAAGDVLTLQKADSGTGLAMPAGLVLVNVHPPTPAEMLG